MNAIREEAPSGFRWLRPDEHREIGDVYEPGSPVALATIGWPINSDTILRPTSPHNPAAASGASRNARQSDLI